ncbi:MAG: transcription-repair coupling factor [Pirellula sp.]|jgi:transcription-repair coupling factor (superfamily II helicase)|nr:transcription-repair coupling factor [Pirellula sp.]
MKSRSPRAKRTLADFIRGTPEPDDQLPNDASPTLQPIDVETLDLASAESLIAMASDPIFTQKPPPKSDSSKPPKRGATRPKEEPTKRETSPAPALLDAIGSLSDYRAAVKLWEAGKPICWEGAWLGSVAPLAATTVRHLKRPMLIVLAHHQDAETVARDLEFYLEHDCNVFPPASDDVDVDSLQQQEVIQRLQVLSQLNEFVSKRSRSSNRSSDAPIPTIPVIVTTLPALMHSVPSPEQMRRDRRVIEVGKRTDLAELKSWLAASGYRTTTSVQLPGEFTARGGILDVYPPDASEPRRIEWFDDEIESIRTFDSITQRSIERLNRVDLLAANEATREDASLLDHLPEDTFVLVSEPIASLHQADAFKARVPFAERFCDPIVLYQRLEKYPLAQITQLAAEGYSGELLRVPIGNVERIGGELENIPRELDQALGSSRNAALVCMNEGELARMEEIVKSCDAYQQGRLRLLVGLLSCGFEIPHGALILTVNQLLRRTVLKRSSKKHASRAIDSFLDLRDGDLVVHLSHGIGIYLGLEMIEKEGQRFEHLVLEFDGGTKLYVPASKIDLVQRYVGGTKTRPKLAKIGGQMWAKQKKAAEAAVADMAADLLELQAQRRSQIGIAFKPDSVWQQQFESSFPYEETVDQLTAIESTKKDMMTPRPMERLICGDVGFGKTEVAMRAAFKAVESGYQVGVLVPTTVLAEQHYKTFKERMAEFPFEIAKLSRFETGAEQRETIRGIASGKIDIVIGTHRIASSDVKFFNLGLLIIDEEQKFGVELKERIKRSSAQVDVLTLSATPIPRTLHMSLVGIRDISNLVTPPEERMAVETRVVRWNDALIRNAILRELNRDGQIFFVHNRIEDMHVVASKLQRIAPEARIVIGHGQMAENGLEQVMLDFIEHRADILLATTIIESGLDISNANTIFIDEADRYGLSELHQLRGRVGRYRNQAHCYLLVDRNKHLNPDAARRLHAIEEFSQLGAGFGIAMRDLEIRGAGNLLGTQQSGHIAAVGYELYCQLLDAAVRQLMRQPPKLSLDVEIHLPIEAYLPANYVTDMRQKIDIYRRVSRLQDVQAVSDMRQELLDRFGELPAPVLRMLDLAELKMDATLWSVRSMSIEDHCLCLSYTDGRRIQQLADKHRGQLRIVDRQNAYWPLWESNPTAASDERTVAQRLAKLDLLAILRQILRY